MFDEEKDRQLALVKRVEKIQVQYKGLPENCTLLMNKNLSTPYNCAMRELLLMPISVLDCPKDMNKCLHLLLHYSDF